MHLELSGTNTHTHTHVRMLHATCRLAAAGISLSPSATGPKCSQLTLHLNVYTSVGGKVLPTPTPQDASIGKVFYVCVCECAVSLLLRDTKVLLLGDGSSAAASATKSFFLSQSTRINKFIFIMTAHTYTLSHTHTHRICGQTVTAPTYCHLAL